MATNSTSTDRMVRLLYSPSQMCAHAYKLYNDWELIFRSGRLDHGSKRGNAEPGERGVSNPADVLADIRFIVVTRRRSRNKLSLKLHRLPSEPNAHSGRWYITQVRPPESNPWTLINTVLRSSRHHFVFDVGMVAIARTCDTVPGCSIAAVELFRVLGTYIRVTRIPTPTFMQSSMIDV